MFVYLWRSLLKAGDGGGLEGVAVAAAVLASLRAGIASFVSFAVEGWEGRYGTVAANFEVDEKRRASLMARIARWGRLAGYMIETYHPQCVLNDIRFIGEIQW